MFLLVKLTTFDPIYQIFHRVLIWLASLLLLIPGSAIIQYIYNLLFSAKDWILGI
jgi:hypothetical protein